MGIEAPINKSNSLYIGQYDLYEALNFLNKKNFNIDKIIPNNKKCDEVNIFFSTKNKIKKNLFIIIISLEVLMILKI